MLTTNANTPATASSRPKPEPTTKPAMTSAAAPSRNAFITAPYTRQGHPYESVHPQTGHS